MKNNYASHYPTIPYVRVDPDAPTPTYAHDGDAGMDLCSMQDVTLAPGETVTVGTGIAMAIPRGWAGLVFPRSGLGSRGLTLSNCVGVIDSTYRGEIKAPLHNNHPSHVWRQGYDEHGEFYGLQPNGETMAVNKGDRVCQIVLVHVGEATLVEMDELDSTDRGEGGFGSSGISGGERL